MTAHKGFTLVEIAVVLIIMGIIAVMAVNVLPGINRLSRTVRSNENLRKDAEAFLRQVALQSATRKNKTLPVFTGDGNGIYYPQFVSAEGGTLDPLADIRGVPWGYIASSADMCVPDRARLMTLILPDGRLNNIGAVFFSNDPKIYGRLRITSATADTPPVITPAESADVIYYTQPELREMLGCMP